MRNILTTLLSVVGLLVLDPCPKAYEYVKDTTVYVGVHRGKTLLIGKLDANGNFIQDARWQGLQMGMPLSGVPPFQIINARRPGREQVFEFRAGRLIKGQLDKEGNFIPDLGSKVLDFKDYEYKKDPLYIYNLPGYFQEKNGKPK
jgi:hypothetical protein